MTRYLATIGDNKWGGWIFSTREQAEKWCEQFGNPFTITEVDDD
jgi:hypothetical protein